MNTYRDFAMLVIGSYDCPYIDELCKDFEIVDEMKGDEMKELMLKALENDIRLDNLLIERLYEKIVEKATEKYGLKKERFDWYINGHMDSHLYYRTDDGNTEVLDIDELKKLKP